MGTLKSLKEDESSDGMKWAYELEKAKFTLEVSSLK